MQNVLALPEHLSFTLSLIRLTVTCQRPNEEYGSDTAFQELETFVGALPRA